MIVMKKSFAKKFTISGKNCSTYPDMTYGLLHWHAQYVLQFYVLKNTRYNHWFHTKLHRDTRDELQKVALILNFVNYSAILLVNSCKSEVSCLKSVFDDELGDRHCQLEFMLLILLRHKEAVKSRNLRFWKRTVLALARESREYLYKF
jgi:hypothetical protein